MNIPIDRSIPVPADDIARLLDRAVSPEIELEQAFEAGELVTVCWEPGCTMHRLPHWDESEWVSCERRDEYGQYSHGICRWHLQKYEQEVARFLGHANIVVRGGRRMMIRADAATVDRAGEFEVVVRRVRFAGGRHAVTVVADDGSELVF